MRIHDPKALLADPEVLRDIVRSHPFLPELESLISILSVNEADEGQGPRVGVTGRDVTLTIHSPSVSDGGFLYILYHELGHVADRFNPAFMYSEEVRVALQDNKLSNFMELWNLFIDARLNARGLFQLVGPNTGTVRIKGNLRLVKASVGTKLNDHEGFLTARGFRGARPIVRAFWKQPGRFVTFPGIISMLDEHMV